jgi:hypothetical protein
MSLQICMRHKCRSTKPGEIIMNASNEDRNDTYNSAYNPFPEPQTIPSGWDMSEFTAVPRDESVVDEEDEAAG